MSHRFCTCTTCSMCGGTGTIKIQHPFIYYGEYELEMCDNCEHGVVDECDYCIEQRERCEDLEP